MEKEFSEDSYVTTDEGEENEEQMDQGYESDVEKDENKDKEGHTEYIKKENIYKNIINVGRGKKPTDIDNVVISSKCWYNYEENQVEVKQFTFENKEFSLDNLNDSKEDGYEHLPKSLCVALQSFRKGETSKVFVKSNYIFKHFDKVKHSEPSEFYNEDFRNKMKDEKIYFEITLHNFFTCQNLMDHSEIRKKILHNGRMWRYPRLPDIVYYNLSCYYNDKLIYDKKDMKAELDQDIELFEIEKRVVQNLKVGEKAQVFVKPSYMKDKNPEFLNKYNIENTKDTIFICEVLDLDVYDYVYKPDKDKLSKKRILHKGFGRDSPDRESLVKAKIQIRVDNKIIYNNFEIEDIKEYLEKHETLDTYPEFRRLINANFNINNLDEDEDFVRDSKIFDSVTSKFPNLITLDLRLYSIPLVIRKVIIHMKRNEITYIKTNFIDYFSAENVELNKINAKIEIYIHLFEFLHRESFSKHSFEEKFRELSNMKEIANNLFKQGKFFRAGKIYSNINYRFSDGQVFSKSQEIPKELETKLLDIRLSCHTNLSSVKFKLNSYNTVYNLTNKILLEMDANNLKAIYLHGKSCIGLKMFEEAVQTFKKLNEISPNNEDFLNSLKESENLLMNDIQKQKSRFKKMIFSSSDEN
jgi:hypothetical protein